MVFSGAGVIINDRSAILNDGFFQGYSWLVAIVILLQVTHNLIVICHYGHLCYRLLAGCWWQLSSSMLETF